MWMPADEALRRLKVKPQTLYANVSRGRIKARPDPADPRRSLYSSADIERLARRGAGRPRDATVATEAISWGEPVLPSAISTVIGGQLYYRGRNAAVFSRTATLEDAAELLWGGFEPAVRPRDIDGMPSVGAAFAALARRAAVDPPSAGRGTAVLRQSAADMLSCLAAALLGDGDGGLHLRLASRFGRPAAAHDLRRALVLLADHELNASTFAVRVTVSTGASFAAGALTGLAALSGPMHGLAARAVAGVAAEFEHDSRPPADILRTWLGEGRAVPGFSHRLYAAGDARATELLANLKLTPAFRAFGEAGEEVLGEGPNVDFALAALSAAHDLPPEAPLTIFALARSVGWLAHMLEQAASGQMIRPRARYIGQLQQKPSA